jgi:hypothetical protein
MQVPWAEPQGRFTLLFERFGVEVLSWPAPASARRARCWTSVELDQFPVLPKSTTPTARLPSPEHPESGSLPADASLWPENHQWSFPPGPSSLQYHPETPLPAGELWLWHWDGLRKNCATHLRPIYKLDSEVVSDCGNSVRVLLEHYAALRVSEDVSREYWKITPDAVRRYMKTKAWKQVLFNAQKAKQERLASEIAKSEN